MSGSEAEAERIRKRQDKLARGEARKARQERMEARAAAERAAIEARQQQLVADARAAREGGETAAAAPKVRHGDVDRPGRDRDVARIAARLEAKQRRDEEDRVAAEARRKGRMGKPFGPKVEVGTRNVPDPYEPGARMVAIVNLAEHPLEMMLSRRRLTQPQYEAGVRYRAIYERATIGPGRGIDPAKIKVDGGRVGDPLTDAVLDAHFQLCMLASRLGRKADALVSAVAGQGVTIADLAVCRVDIPGNERSRRDYLTLRFKEALDFLHEEVWGNKPNDARPGDVVIGARDLGSGEVDERAVAVANQRFLNRRGIGLAR